MVFHKIKLYPHMDIWLDELLTVTNGLEKPWSPDWSYEFLPEGIAEVHDKLCVTLPNGLVMFSKKYDPDIEDFSDKSLKNTGYQVRKNGEFLTVENSVGRQWVFKNFSSVGDHWKLVHLGYRKFPHRKTVIEYQNNNIANIILPNKLVITFDYMDNFVSAVHYGSYQTIIIDRTREGYIKSLKFFKRESEKKISKEPFRQFFYEMSSQGKIFNFTNDCDVKFSVENRDADLGNNLMRHTVVIENTLDGSYRFRQQTTQQDSTLDFEEGFGEKDLPIDQAYRLRVLKYKKNNHAYRVVEQSKGDDVSRQQMIRDKNGQVSRSTEANGSETAYTYDPEGRILSKSFPNGKEERYWYGPAGELLKESDEDLTITTYTYDEFLRVTKISQSGNSIEYQYNFHGDLVRSITPSGIHSFEYDELGNIIEHVRPDGLSYYWAFDHYRLPIQEKLLLNNEVKHNIMVTRNDWGQIVKIEDKDGRVDTYQYKNGLLSSVWENCKLSNLEYDVRGRLIKVFDRETETSKIYEYNLANKVIHEKTVSKDQYLRSWFNYDKYGRVIEKKMNHDKPEKIYYDKAGRAIHIVHPDGKNSVYSYDKFDRVISIRGNKEVAKDILYTPDGEKIETLVDISGETITIPEDRKDFYSNVKANTRKYKPKQYTKDLAMETLARSVLIFGSPDCGGCNWATKEWYPRFAEKFSSTGVEAYFVDIDKEDGIQLLIEFEAKYSNGLYSATPVVYANGNLHYGTKEIDKIQLP